ncbi:DUF5777 family beta-barrel protein [Rufibacter tibetensis]|uniref:DUF5777 domain-containing protein n=1 Tax=Rufibacter tibetensis TaxID=512763 RepID=A0A0N7HWX4_9BACT|nr:DUF5777 family beta-barrel protein [Rufibacter tibetensis]ALJ00457.1 hypothetical protein DC20_17635 [Rufibacter tibetensis]
MKILLPLLFSILIFCSHASAQDDSIFHELDLITEPEKQDVLAAFKSTRVILAPSIERVQEKQLHFRVSHLFSPVSLGYKDLFGLDQLVNMNLSLEYGINNRVQVGLARSNKADKTLMPNIKVSLLRQSTGKKAFPLYVSYFGNLDWKTNTYSSEAQNNYFLGRLDYVNMLLLARKVNQKLSVQLSPAWLHRNLTDNPNEPNDLYALGFSGRYMFNGHMSFNWEYFYTLPTSEFIQTKNNPLSLGVDIETGGHVFQLYFSNASALHLGRFLRNQNGNFFDGTIQFGFSIMREFNLNH